MADSNLFDVLAQNRQTLTWLGGGLATAVGGAWVAVKYFLDRGAAKESSGKPSDKGKPGSKVGVSVASGVGGGRDVHVGGNISIQQTQLPKAGIVLAVIGLLLLGVAVMNAGHNVAVSNGSYVGRDVTNSQINTTRVGPADEKPK